LHVRRADHRPVTPLPKVPRSRPIQLAPTPRADLAPQRPARHRPCQQEDGPVIVSLPLVLVLGVAVFFAYRYMHLKVWQAVLCLLFGFLLAATTAAPDIRAALTAVLTWLSGPRH
jgi:hypothetical protein